MNDFDPEEVSFDPGDIEEFASYLLDLADYWWDEGAAAYRLANSSKDDDWYPKLGEFEEASTFLQSHVEKWRGMATAFAQLHAAVEGLAEGAKKVAETYRDLDSANADNVDSLVDPELQESVGEVETENGGNGQNQQRDPNIDPANSQAADTQT